MTQGDLGSRARPPMWRRVLASILVVCCLVWVGLLLRDAWTGASLDLEKLDSGRVLAGLSLGVCASLLGWVAFIRLLTDIGGSSRSLVWHGHLYYAGQIMKHLPGRVWGIGYQIATTRGDVTAATWLSSNLIHLLLMMGLALLTSVVVLMAPERPMTALTIAIVGVGSFLAFSPAMLHALAGRILPHRESGPLARLRIALEPMQHISGRHFRLAIAFGLASWLVYFCSWSLYVSAYPGLGIGEGFRMCALYTLAWLIGYVALVTPSGLGVRELAFSVLAKEFAPAAVAYGLVMGRLALLIIDIVLALIFIRAPRQ